MSKKIALIVGSLRKASYNRKIANELIRLQPDGLELEIVEIGEMPHYNEDLETETPPQAWVDFREKMLTMNGVIFVTPEYNRTIPGVLKNAIDVGSRPYGSSVWKGKPGAVISVTPGTTGAFGANHNVRQAVVFLGVPMCPFEAYIGGVSKLFDEQGNLAESTQKVLTDFLGSYKNWAEKF
ncbi:MAG: NAD(P)H-dependent oxidoreductase [Acidobacteria bacterium]|nr:NAD(P)H-dependent oxidoreductase [Acidobacteriota bacterium]